MTLDEIRNVEFTRGRGYRTDEVDDFIDNCVEAMEALVRENEDLKQKMQVLADKVNEYRADEDNIRGALLNAHRTGETILRDANAKAEQIIHEAEAKAQHIREDANGAIAQENDELARLQRETTAFKTRLLSLYKEHLALISALPEVKEEKAAPAEAPADANVVGVPEEPEQAPETEEEGKMKPISRFDGLKFGADYDITEDEEEPETRSHNPFRKKK